MPYSVALKYWQAIDVLQARETMVELNVADYPKMKHDARKKFHRDLRNKGFPQHMQKELSFEDFAKKVGMVNGRRKR